MEPKEPKSRRIEVREHVGKIFAMVESMRFDSNKCTCIRIGLTGFIIVYKIMKYFISRIIHL